MSLLLRIGLASVFLYAGVAGFLEPYNWIGYMPQILRHFFPDALLLNGFSAYEIILGLFILSNWKIVYFSLLAGITTLGIILFNIGALDIVFRDFTIFFTAIALAIANIKKKK